MREFQKRSRNANSRIQRVRLACSGALLLGALATGVRYQHNANAPLPESYEPLPQFLQAEHARFRLATGLPLERLRNQEAFRRAVRVLQRDATDADLESWTPDARLRLDEYERIVEATFGRKAVNVDSYKRESVNLAADALDRALRKSPNGLRERRSARGAILPVMLAAGAGLSLFSRRNYRSNVRLTATEVTEMMPWPTVTTNPSGEVLSVSQSMVEWQREGKLSFLTPNRSVASQPGLAKLLRRVGDQDATDLHVDHWTPDDDSHFEINIAPAANTSTPMLLWTFRDVTDELKRQSDLMQKAFHDNLTGLPNRSLFRDRTTQALERSKRSDQIISVLFIDLDGFKNVNDSLGHDAGDELIVEMGRRLSSLVRTPNSLARLGGDEFAVLIEDQRTRLADLVAERILQQVRMPMRIRGKEVFVSASIGLCEAGPGHTTEDLLRNADTAMYAAKDRGKNQVVRFHSMMFQDANERLELDSELRRAIQLNQLKLHYQPIVSLEEGRMRGVEALARWLHPTRGLIPPDVFIPIAEDSGSILAIGQWVLRTAISHASEFSDLTLHVNVSARQLNDDKLLSWLENELRHSGFAPARLVLEITESVFLGDINATVERLQKFRALGVGLAIDDFGTGYSSLSYLHRLPIQSVKIDRSFLQGRLTRLDLEADPFVLAILELARTLGFDTVAEGVETEEQVAWLGERGCNYGQGYFFARAMPAESIALAAAEFDAIQPSSQRITVLPHSSSISSSSSSSDNGEPMVKTMAESLQSGTSEDSQTGAREVVR